MQDIVILPIFNQAAPDVWDDFAHIRVSSVESIYNSIYDADDIDGMIYADKEKWGKRFINFAFGAYLGSEMVGFIQGDAHGRCANIQSLYVLKEYQKLGVGHRLLSRAERAASIFAKRVELVSLSKAEPFILKMDILHNMAQTDMKSWISRPRVASVCLYLDVIVVWKRSAR